MILIVEDDPLARHALQKLLSSRGYRTRAVGSGEAALIELQNSEKPHMLLIDVDLPGMTGLDLVRELRATRPELRCTLMSGESGDSVRQAGLMIPFLSKPLDTKRLLLLVADREHDA